MGAASAKSKSCPYYITLSLAAQGLANLPDLWYTGQDSEGMATNRLVLVPTNQYKEVQGMYTEDERVMAALAHASIILNLFTGIGGIIAAVAIYLVRKEKSAWVASQALQAAVYQGITAVGTFVLLAIAAALSVIGVGLCMFPLIGLLGLAIVAYGCYAGYLCYQGKDFKYPWIADLLAQK